MTKTIKPTPKQIEALIAIRDGSVVMRNQGHAAFRVSGASPTVVGRLVNTLKWARWPKGAIGEQTCELTEAGAAALVAAVQPAT